MPVVPSTRPVPNATLIAPQLLLPVCCVCGLIRDEAGSSLQLERWVSPQIFQQVYGAHSTKAACTHTYCPECFTKAQETMQQYFREIRSAGMGQQSGSPIVDAAHQGADLPPAHSEAGIPMTV